MEGIKKKSDFKNIELKTNDASALSQSLVLNTDLHFNRYKLTIEYNGEPYCGFQRQFLPEKRSIEEVLIGAIKKLSGEEVKIATCGRTDAGVHALAQVIHFDLSKEFTTHQILMGLNHYLRSESIAAIACKKVDKNFHARFSTKMRHYRYIILNRQAPAIIEKNRLWHIPRILDTKLIKHAAAFLVGEHDFSSFRDRECQAKSAVRTISSIMIRKEDDKIYIDVSAKSFLHHMVRNIVGTLAYVGLKKIEVSAIPKILAAKNRIVSGPNAPAYGLYFLRADYD